MPFFSQPSRARLASLLTLLLCCAGAQAAEVRVAVAANFTAAMKEIAADFEHSSGHRLLVSFGSTGKLYAQITHGAPFHLFLAADQARPERLEKQRLATDRFTYAIGKLVLWSAQAAQTVSPERLQQGDFRRLAIANPKTAPYGVAAVEVMEHLGVYAPLKSKLITGDSIAQTYQFVVTGNAELGFVALAQVALAGSGNQWRVPESLYTPIRQDAVLLDKGRDNVAALAFMTYLRSDRARAIIRKFGYGIEAPQGGKP